MRPHLTVLLLTPLALPATAFAQTACIPAALPEAAKAVGQLRHTLHEEAITENDPHVPALVATQLAQLKTALNTAAETVFACANPTSTPEALEKTLADALHANLHGDKDTPIEIRGKKELGAYGSDLAVQVFPLYGSPRYVEVDFRYGVECGDDNLLLVFSTDIRSTANTAWHEVLRWGAPSYNTVADAIGDFVLLTPLSGFEKERNWRFVVAHGQPSCGALTSPSRFDLDILEPTADPAQPQTIWHMEHPYTRNQVPRLSTTEDTLSFQLAPPQDPHKTAKVPAHTDTFRYRVTRDNQVEPLTSSPPPSPSSDSPR